MEENTNCVECGGCTDNASPVMPPQNTAGQNCSENNPCSTITLADCVIYNGSDIECGADVVVAQGSSVATALRNVVAYICNRLANIFPIDIQGAGSVTVSSAQNPVTGEVTYTVTGETVKFVKEIETTFPATLAVIDVTDTEIQACSIANNGCGEDPILASDFHAQIWIKYDSNDYWDLLQSYTNPSTYWKGRYDLPSSTFTAEVTHPVSLERVKVRLVLIY
jgi:hypothetical protein